VIKRQKLSLIMTHPRHHYLPGPPQDSTPTHRSPLKGILEDLKVVLLHLLSVTRHEPRVTTPHLRPPGTRSPSLLASPFVATLRSSRPQYEDAPSRVSFRTDIERWSVCRDVSCVRGDIRGVDVEQSACREGYASGGSVGAGPALCWESDDVPDRFRVGVLGILGWEERCWGRFGGAGRL
jgi:hypothetical protein